MNRRRSGPPPVDGRRQHLDWLALVEVSGPFLTLPVLRAAWPTLDALEQEARDALRAAHAAWRADPGDPATQRDWIRFVMGELLEWDDAVEFDPDQLGLLADGDQAVDFALVDPGEAVKPDATRLLGLICPPGTVPTALRRDDGDDRAAAAVDRLARLCRRHGVELGLATDGRWWSLVWAPAGGVTTVATFDAVSWPEQADRDVVRAFRSLLRRSRFFSARDDETLVALLRESQKNQEDVTDALGVQVRRAVELLVDAVGRAELRSRERGEDLLAGVPAQDVYRGAVAVMMRLVFLLFAEERGLLPADSALYRQAYSAGGLCDTLEQAARDASEEDLEHSGAAWMRLLALFSAVYRGVSHPRLTMPAYDGSIFDPQQFPWLEALRIDDRTVLHMLRAVQYVQLKGERRRLSFKALDVEQIGYVYEGLLSFEGRRAADTVVGLIGKEGLEDEVSLTELEAHAAVSPDVATLGARLAEAHKDSKLGTPAAVAKRLAPLGAGERAEALRLLLAATGGDLPLSERLLPFVRLLRTDLRGLPVVIARDALYVTESKLRKNTGTHYTPRALAEQVVEGALEPLVYHPGPLQAAESAQWVLRKPEEIIALKVADIAMGSGAFLVAACRYLAARLLESRSEYGQYILPGPEGGPIDVGTHPAMIDARRDVIQHCLYGVDINPMAVEMAKLSLWLVSMDPHRPFTFLDDRLACGDSLLGVTSLEQIEYMHLDPAEGRRLHRDSLLDVTAGVRSVVAEVAEQRRRLAEMPGDTLEALRAKREMLNEAEAAMQQARLYADLVVAATLAGSGKRAGSRDPLARLQAQDDAEWSRERLMLHAADLAAKAEADGPAAQDQVAGWLTVDQPRSGLQRRPLHWPLAFPEVFAGSGFDAIVGNPPYLGGTKVSPTLGTSYREYCATYIGFRRGTNVDLVAYFTVRAHELVSSLGQVGLLATNTLWQGDTRVAGLDGLCTQGVEIRRAIKGRPWPSRSAALEYCAIWTSVVASGPNGTPPLIDDRPVAGITSALDEVSRISEPARRLVANRAIGWLGHHVNGMGFVLSAEEAEAIIERDPRSREVIMPYINGEDLSQTPTSSATRFIINFRDWPLERVQEYEGCFRRLELHVKPERQTRNRESHRRLWWKYADYRAGLEQSILGMQRVVVITLVSKVVMPVMVPTGQVFAHRLGVFATDDLAMLALLSSAPHYWWAIMRSSTMKADLNYSMSDVFETFPRPVLTAELRVLGARLDGERHDLMLARRAGLTATYNLVHNPTCIDTDIAALRDLHRAIDEEVMRAYGWDDLDLEHGFHETRQGVRYTVGPVPRQEILDRLLELNQQRYAEEVAKGLHDKKKPKPRKQAAPQQEGMF